MKRALVLVVALLLGGVTAALAANPEPPTATTGGASAVATTSATVAGTVNPGGADTTWLVRYGTSTNYGLTTPAQTVPAGTTAQSVSAPLTGLTPNTTYHYKVVAQNAAGNAEGSDRSFTTKTAPAAPTATTSSATALKTDSAQLRGSVDPNGTPSRFAFEWGTTTSYGAITQFQDAGSGTSAKAVSQFLTFLQPGTTYHFRIVVESARGTIRGADRTFTTAKVPLAVALGASPDPVTYGRAVTIEGRLSGTGVAGQAVTLQSNPFPYSRGFRNVGSPLVSDANGVVRFLVAPFSKSTLFRLTIRNAASAAVLVEVKPRISLRVRKVRGKRQVRLTGTVRPGDLSGVISIQRRNGQGRFVPLKRVALSAHSGGATYSTTVRRVTGRVYRAVLRSQNGPVLEAASSARRTPR